MAFTFTDGRGGKRGSITASGATGILPTGGEYFSDRLVIRGPDQNYSEAYTALTRAFYLFM